MRAVALLTPRPRATYTTASVAQRRTTCYVVSMHDELWRGERAPELAAVLRRARKAAGVSLRELARRCGVSAGQLSRIESGDVGRPEMETVRVIADALGVPAVPLLVLAGHLGQEELEQYVKGREGTFDTEDIWLAMEGELTNDEQDRTLGPLDAAAMIIDRWSRRALASELGFGDDSSRGQLEEITAAWPGLTEDRRRFVLAFVADQEVLSRLDRMPNPPGRYMPRIALELTAAADV